MYREPLYKKDQRRDRINSEVEIPPASSSFSDMFDDDGKFMYVLEKCHCLQFIKHQPYVGRGFLFLNRS